MKHYKHFCFNQGILISRWSNLWPNARPEPLPEAGAQRTLEAVGSRPLFGPRLHGLTLISPFRCSVLDFAFPLRLQS